MSKYNDLISKVRDWSNKQSANTIPDQVIGDALSYAADEAYRTLRIPPLEYSIKYTVAAEDNAGEQSLGLPYGNAWTIISIPEDLTEFIYIRTVYGSNVSTPYATYPTNASIVFNEVTDARTFLDIYSEKYSAYNFMWKNNQVYIHPQLSVGQELELHYYRRLPALDACYAVIPVNYLIGLGDSLQPYLTLTGVATDTPLYFAGAGSLEQCFATLAEATAYGLTQPITTVTTKYYVGQESPNWLRDEYEQLLMFGALMHMGAYLFDDKMEQRYGMRYQDKITQLNKEEKFRRARGGNVQINVNTKGLI